MLNRRNYTRNGHDWNPMPDMELANLRGEVVFLEGGSRKGGFGRVGGLWVGGWVCAWVRGCVCVCVCVCVRVCVSGSL